MTEIQARMHFLVWPKTNREWQRDVERLQPSAEELWNRVHAAVPEAMVAPCRVFTVAGLFDGDGASTTAASLAYYAAQEAKQRVLLVEADLRRPKLHSLGLVPRCLGLAGVLQREAQLKNAVFELGSVGFYVLPAGKPVPSPSVHLNAAKLGAFLTSVQAFFDTIVIDAPPFTIAPETRCLVAAADATIPVLRSGRVLPEHAAYWIAKIGEYRGRVGAVCLSAVNTPLPTRLRALL